jgi:arabinofuranosyltransferase
MVQSLFGPSFKGYDQMAFTEWLQTLKTRIQSPLFGFRISDFVFFILIFLSLFSPALYLLVARFGSHRFGFPLDDAWIYQTYAHNLARTGQWAFVPGAPSAGATSILWTLLIVPIHWLGSDPRLGTHALGAVMLLLAALGAARFAGGGQAANRRVAFAAGALLALEWHMAWMAASGMETLLFAALLIWYWALADWLKARGLIAGLWGGALMLARPEGVVALGVMGLYGLVFGEGGWLRRLRWAILAALGFGLVLGPFFAFNYAISGTLWPNTFYAKQTEYAILWATPYLRRWLAQLVQPFIGPQVLLIPGVVLDVWRNRKHPAAWLPWVWAFLHVSVYAARLPVIYQHGRYMMPLIPLIVAAGARGMLSVIRLRDTRPLVRMPSTAWLLSVLAAFPAFLIALGAPAYADDVRLIEDEMVATARWVAENTPPDAVIAAHDIGALGYFAPRPLVDLAGLASPDVIPVMDDDRALLAFIRERGADYVVAFPHWSPTYERLLVDPCLSPVWSSGELTPEPLPSGLGRMTVYEWACR